MDPDPAFYLSADPDPDPGSQTSADPMRSGNWSDFKVTKSKKIYIKNILTVGIRSTNMRTKLQKPFLRRRKSGYL